jgi:hypothetical protein
MTDEDKRQVIERVANAINQRRLDLFNAEFTDDSIIEYPQSGERIVGAKNRAALYASFPALPSLKPTRLTVSGDVVVAEVDYRGTAEYKAVFIFTLRDGKIAREIAYWSEPFPAPAWRSQWVEKT